MASVPSLFAFAAVVVVAAAFGTPSGLGAALASSAAIAVWLLTEGREVVEPAGGEASGGARVGELLTVTDLAGRLRLGCYFDGVFATLTVARGGQRRGAMDEVLARIPQRWLEEGRHVTVTVFDRGRVELRNRDRMVAFRLAEDLAAEPGR